MGGSVNSVMLVGNLGRDAELRYTTSGAAVANLNMATTTTWKDKDSGTRKEKVEWHRVVYFGKGAEAVSPYLKKGQLVCVQGRLETRQFDDKDGNKRTITEVRADDVTLLGANPGHTRDDHDQRRESAPAAAPPALDDDDIPF